MFEDTYMYTYLARLVFPTQNKTWLIMTNPEEMLILSNGSMKISGDLSFPTPMIAIDSPTTDRELADPEKYQNLSPYMSKG